MIAVFVVLGLVVLVVLLGDRHVQPADRPEEPEGQRLEADRRAAQAPPRSDSQPRQHGARRDGVRARHADRRDGGARQGDGRRRPGRREPQGRRADPGARPALRGGRELPAAQGEREREDAAGGAVGHREQDRLRAPVLQRHRDEVQHRARDVSRPTSSPARSTSRRPSSSRSPTPPSARCRPSICR